MYYFLIRGGFCVLNWLNSCSVFGGHWSVLKINLFQGHCVGLFTSTSLPVSLCSFPAAVLHCLPLPAYTYSTKTSFCSKCTNVDSYFIVVFRLWRAFLLLSISSFRTPLHPGAFKTANNHPVPCTSTVWGWTVWGCFWCIEYQTEIKSSQTAASLWLQS